MKMITYDLRCHRDHVFEGWFRTSEACDEQLAAKQASCPFCSSTRIEKALMAPRVSGARKKSDAPPPALTKKAALETKKATELRKALVEMRKTVEANFDYVGPGFADKAREIHYGEAESRNIYGETSDEEARSLQEEGVEVQRIPWLPRENS